MSRAHSLIDESRRQLDRHKPAERRLADVVLSDIGGATRLTTRELSGRAAVSERRWCASPGASAATATAFKLRLSEDFATGRMFSLSDPPAVTQDPAAIASQVYEAAAQALPFSFAQRDLPAA